MTFKTNGLRSGRRILALAASAVAGVVMAASYQAPANAGELLAGSIDTSATAAHRAGPGPEKPLLNGFRGTCRRCSGRCGHRRCHRHRHHCKCKTGPRGPQGARGPAGPAGPAGPPGPPGPAAPTPKKPHFPDKDPKWPVKDDKWEDRDEKWDDKDYEWPVKDDDWSEKDTKSDENDDDADYQWPAEKDTESDENDDVEKKRPVKKDATSSADAEADGTEWDAWPFTLKGGSDREYFSGAAYKAPKSQAPAVKSSAVPAT